MAFWIMRFYKVGILLDEIQLYEGRRKAGIWRIQFPTAGIFYFFFFFQCKELCILVEMSVKLSYPTMKILLFKLRTLCCLSLNILDSL